MKCTTIKIIIKIICIYRKLEQIPSLTLPEVLEVRVAPHPIPVLTIIVIIK